MRNCRKCNRDLPNSEFYQRKDGTINRRVCKACWRLDAQAYREANREHYREYQIAYREKNRYYERRSRLERDYGITLDQFEKMILDQGARCAICKCEFRSQKDTHVDHDHDKGHVRGILCSNCNVGIGNLRDDPVLLRSAIEYLESRSA